MGLPFVAAGVDFAGAGFFKPEGLLVVRGGGACAGFDSGSESERALAAGFVDASEVRAVAFVPEVFFALPPFGLTAGASSSASSSTDS